MAVLGHRRLVRTCKYPTLTWRYFQWRYLQNLASLVAYRFSRRPLSSEASRILAELNRNGVATTSAQDLLGSDSCYHELLEAVDRAKRDLTDIIAKARASADDLEGHETYTFRLLGNRPQLNPDDIYVRFALQKPILQIANAYFGMYTRLRFYDVWHTFATELPARYSQLWHRDPEDNFVLKVFVYLSDVTDRTGPFTYAAGTHLKGGFCREPAYTRRKGDSKRSDDSQMAKVASPERWIKCSGPKGTMIFADTRGYHKGGFVQERERIMYTCTFTSQASKVKDYYERPERILLPKDKEQAFALNG